MVETIQVGFQVYSKEGGEEFGAVRAVERGHRPQIVVYVENAGDFVVLPDAIKSVHDGKVILDLAVVGADMRNAVSHAHERERL